jgi:hypothetical protein
MSTEGGAGTPGAAAFASGIDRESIRPWHALRAADKIGWRLAQPLGQESR